MGLSVDRELNPELRILVRAHYVSERQMLEHAGASDVCYEEAEATVFPAELLLHEIGVDDDTINKRSNQIRDELESPLGVQSMPH